MLFPVEVEVLEVARISITADHAREVFAYWRGYHPKSFPRPHDKSNEWRKIVARFNEGYSVAQLCRAIDGIHKSPWHNGENPTGTKYVSLELCVRDAGKVERFIEIANTPEGPVLTEKTQRTVRALSNWANRKAQE